MKFRITKSDFDLLRPFFEGEKQPGFQEINLEPVDQTLMQAVNERDIRNISFIKGHEEGYRYGYHDGMLKRAYRCSCGCGGTTCWNRHCGTKCL